MSNPLTSAQFVRLLTKNLREVSENTITDLSKKEDMISQLFRILPSDKAFEEFYSVGAVPDIPEFTGRLEYLSISPGFYIKIEPKTFAGGLQFERKLIEDKQYDVFNDRAEGLSTAAYRVRQKYGARVFANAFTSTFDFMTNEEGVSLCSSSHTTKSGTSTSSGFSNAGTSALSKTSVAATRLLMRRFRNDISERVDVDPDMLIVPDNLADTAEEIVGTEKGLDSAEGNINPQHNRYKVVVWRRLDDYDTNNWFMVDSNLMKKMMVWIDRVKPEPNTTIDFESFIIKHSVYFRIGTGYTDWRFCYGSNVT